VREITQRKLAEQQLKEAYHAVEALAGTDALTGLANRRRFDQTLLTEWRRALRDRRSLSLVLIDADYFKSYNDTYGHLRGDSCLKQIASTTQELLLRPADLAARFGGEEFAVILPDTPNKSALAIAQEICSGISGRKLPHGANPLGVLTVSVGCATLVPQLGQFAASLIECADEALYKAKRSGRNRVCNYSAHQGPGIAGAIVPKSA
jgi:diguanylate cyclase (GGDEF)-like protein